MAKTIDDVARAAAEQLIRNCGDLRVLSIPQFIDRVTPVIKDAIETAMKETT